MGQPDVGGGVNKEDVREDRRYLQSPNTAQDVVYSICVCRGMNSQYFPSKRYMFQVVFFSFKHLKSLKIHFAFYSQMVQCDRLRDMIRCDLFFTLSWRSSIFR